MAQAFLRRFPALLSLHVVAALLGGGCSSVRTVYEPSEEYESLVAELESFIEEEMREKGLPALSIVLVDDQEIVWAKGFGRVDPRQEAPATAATVFRVGSVSKLFTDIAVMQLVEKGELDLDAPITDYLPELRPQHPFDKPITLRQLMSHRSGLVREPPIGHYFDSTEPSLAETVDSLNGTTVIFEPETRTKYSNAGVAVAGYVLERLKNQPFEEYIDAAVLQPMALERSTFRLNPEIRRHLAKGSMWTYDGRDIDIDTEGSYFELGTSPAGNLYATMPDLGRFLNVLFNGGAGPGGQILSPETLESMWTPQFVADGMAGYGLGFYCQTFEGHRAVGHSGAVYGFATSLLALPEAKVGVAAVATMDVSNAVVSRIVKHALRCMLARREGAALPQRTRTLAVDGARARRLAGTFRDVTMRPARLLEREGRLYLDHGSLTRELRASASGPGFVTDGRLDFGTEVWISDDGKDLRVGDVVYKRVAEPRPAPVPDRWRGLIGEYGWDYNTLYILEKDGQLHALIEWFFLYPLQELSADVFAFPDRGGLYDGEKLIFRRDSRGFATQVKAAGIVFPRLAVGFIDGEIFHIDPNPDLPEEKLREMARNASPPREDGPFRDTDLVEMASLDPTIKYDIRYASTRNFMRMVFYKQSKAFLQRPAAEAVVRAHTKLKRRGYGLLIHDAYRPWYVTKMFYDATGEDDRRYVADPAKGSRHNRGCAVDLTLYDLATGEPVEMVSGYDEFKPRAYPFYPGGTSEQRWLRDLLKRTLEEEGFRVYEWEWWHFDYVGSGEQPVWMEYPIVNATFEEIEQPGDG